MLIIYPRKIRRSYLALNVPVAVGNQDIKMILNFINVYILQIREND